MVLIKVKPKDDVKVFSILLKGGRFSGLQDNRYILYEGADLTLKKIKDAGIKLIEVK